MDFSNVTDDQLSDHLNDVLAEQERRKALTEIPHQIQELTAKYVAGGGDIEDLK